MDIFFYLVIITSLAALGIEMRKRGAFTQPPSRKQKPLAKDHIIRLIKQEVKPTTFKSQRGIKTDIRESHFYNLKTAYDRQVAVSLGGNRIVQIDGAKVMTTPHMREQCMFASRKLRNDVIRDYAIDLAKLEIAKTR